MFKAFAKQISRQIMSSGASAVDPAKNLSCSRFEVDGWAVSNFVLQKIVPVAGVHPFPLQELMLMVSATCRLKPPVIFEWGTNIGKSARIFYETVSHYKISSQIHSIDLPDEVSHIEHPMEKRGALVQGISAVMLHQGDGLSTSLRIWKDAASPVNPLFFIDGDHGYESVRREIDGILHSIPQASILLHDTFYQSPESHYNIGPHQAVNETIRKFPERFEVIHSGLSLPGMTLLTPALPIQQS
jgi:hypothetical protein